MEFIRRAIDAGIRALEVTSFVHPKRMPQMADAEAVIAALPKRDDVRYIGLVLNRKGFERARDAGLGEIGMAVVASDTYNRRNQGVPTEHDIDKYVRLIAGQEYGTKGEHLKFAAKGKYPDNKILIIGDAPGDYSAAKSNGVSFYPVNPGHEDASWERFYKEALDKFFNGTYAGAYEEKLFADFDSYLPEKPPWSR